jgi:hypothetical protein
MAPEQLRPVDVWRPTSSLGATIVSLAGGISRGRAAQGLKMDLARHLPA